MERRSFEVEGCRIASCAVGDDLDDALVLVHGARAHRHWWDAAVEAGLGDDRRRVAAFDLSGHGDSGRRREYSPELWADEALATIEQCAGGRAALAGHSMGGLVALVAAARRPDLVTALVLVDTRIRLTEGAEALIPRGSPPKALRSFPSREAALAAFRLFPPQPVVDPEVERRVAAQSIEPLGDGWGWKFDPAGARQFYDELINRYLREVTCPVAMVYGECSALVSGESPRAAEEILGRAVPATVVAGAHHHLILDRPAAGAGAIAGALAAATLT